LCDAFRSEVKVDIVTTMLMSPRTKKSIDTNYAP
jgi:hypothetical protein